MSHLFSFLILYSAILPSDTSYRIRGRVEVLGEVDFMCEERRLCRRGGHY